MIQYVITSRDTQKRVGRSEQGWEQQVRAQEDEDPLYCSPANTVAASMCPANASPVRVGFEPCDELRRGFDGTIVYESTCELGAELCGSDERFFDFLGSNELQERGDAVLGPLDTTLDGRHDVGR